MDKKTISTMKKMFDDIMHTAEDGTVEFWYAREIMGCLGYTTWRRFKDAINRAMESCKSAEIEVSDHFADAVKMVEIGSNAVRDVDDIMLTRYACYLIAQNGDPRKEEIAFAQSYFAVQTRKQELIEERIAYIQRTEARGKLRESEKRLSQNIYERGVDDAGFGRIRSKGDQALFGGRSTQEMKEKLGVSDKRPLADFLPTLTIAAKNLATEMTNYNVEEKDLKGEGAITTEHVQNNTTVREMLGTRGIKPNADCHDRLIVLEVGSQSADCLFLDRNIVGTEGFLSSTPNRKGRRRFLIEYPLPDIPDRQQPA